MQPQSLIGRRYQSSDAPGQVWEVVSLVADLAPQLHVRMQPVGDDSRYKLIAATALHDRNIYEDVTQAA